MLFIKMDQCRTLFSLCLPLNTEKIVILKPKIQKSARGRHGSKLLPRKIRPNRFDKLDKLVRPVNPVSVVKVVKPVSVVPFVMKMMDLISNQNFRFVRIAASGRDHIF